MTHHLKDIYLALAAGRVIVTWYYAPNDAAGNPLGEYGGWFGLSKPAAVTKPP
jgi:hypothetical protein